jgi:hypothetical protein
MSYFLNFLDSAGFILYNSVRCLNWKWFEGMFGNIFCLLFCAFILFLQMILNLIWFEI